MGVLTILLSIWLGGLVALWFYLTRSWGTLETTGLPIIKPFLCLGSPPFALHKMRLHEWYVEKFRQLGNTFGRYMGSSPAIATIDPEFIKEVTVKQFDNFTDAIAAKPPPEQTDLSSAGGDAWRALRKMMSPTFSSGKLKGMLEPVEDIADKAINHLEEQVKINSEIDMKPLLQGFTLDAISRVAFGMNTNVHRGEDQEFAKTAYEVFGSFTGDSLFNVVMFQLLFLFPKLIEKLGFWPESAMKIAKMAQDIMTERDQKNVTNGDFIDRLREYKKVMVPPVTGPMINAQSMVFLTAGFETTANTLGSMMYFFATHPDLQDKVYEEMVEHVDDDDNVTYETTKEMHYLEAFTMETLRMKPPLVEHDRICVKDCVVNGIKVKQGTTIQMPIYAAHYNEEFFPEPFVFNPDRFLKENEDQIIPYTWRPFGAGNRVCIGQRFALLEIKIFVAKLLQKFKIVQTSKTAIATPKGTMFLLTYPEIVVMLERR